MSVQSHRVALELLFLLGAAPLLVFRAGLCPRLGVPPGRLAAAAAAPGAAAFCWAAGLIRVPSEGPRLVAAPPSDGWTVPPGCGAGPWTLGAGV